MADVTEYEQRRAQRIQENRRKMQELGLLEASLGLPLTAGAAAPTVLLEAGSERPPPRKKPRRAPQAQPAAQEPTRLSRRLRGETALRQEEAVEAARAELEAEGGAAACRGAAGGGRKQLALEEGVQLSAPFTLWSIGVTVWELGHVHRGAWAHRYWSSSGCLYHHAYPVGYRATKVQFGRTYEMRIEEGPTGPLFKVIDQQTGTVFAGASPTKPWTDVCIAHRTGQRISGPLFFGFSDQLTQAAIASNLYNAAELRAALQGEKIETGSSTPEEQAAAEFCTVEGVGEATAIVLARSTSLGDRRHAGLESLKAWAGASYGNAQALFEYLTGSLEVPESTRRWPAWRQRIAPKIVLAISGRWLGAGPPPAAAAPSSAQEGGAAADGSSDGPPQQTAPADQDHGADGTAIVPQQGMAQQQQPQQHAQRPAGQPAVSPAEQQLQQAPEVRAAPGSSAAAKENQQPLRPKAAAADRAGKAAAGAAGVAAAAAAAAEGTQRSSGRERKANSLLAQFVVEEEAAA